MNRPGNITRTLITNTFAALLFMGSPSFSLSVIFSPHREPICWCYMWKDVTLDTHGNVLCTWWSLHTKKNSSRGMLTAHAVESVSDSFRVFQCKASVKALASMLYPNAFLVWNDPRSFASWYAIFCQHLAFRLQPVVPEQRHNAVLSVTLNQKRVIPAARFILQRLMNTNLKSVSWE